MQRLVSMFILATLVAIAACNTTSTSPTATSSSLSSAFTSLPIGFEFVPSTFTGGSAADSDGWAPPPPGGRGGPGGGLGPDDDGPGGADRGFGLAGGGMMCGGLGGAFGGQGLGLGFGRGLFGGIFAGSTLPGNCAFNSGSGRVVCDTVQHDGLSIVRSAQYQNAGGAVQSAFDSLTTNSINLQVAVSGTRVRHDNDTSVVQHASDRTVTGLAPGSAARTVNGTSRGLETIKGANSTGAFTAVRSIGDTVTGVVIPVHGDSISFPTAGTVIRAAKVTVTYTTGSPTTSTRREVVTYNGTSTATVVITKNDSTRNCTIALPHGHLVCS